MPPSYLLLETYYYFGDNVIFYPSFNSVDNVVRLILQTSDNLDFLAQYSQYW